MIVDKPVDKKKARVPPEADNIGNLAHRRSVRFVVKKFEERLYLCLCRLFGLEKGIVCRQCFRTTVLYKQCVEAPESAEMVAPANAEPQARPILLDNCHEIDKLSGSAAAIVVILSSGVTAQPPE